MIEFGSYEFVETFNERNAGCNARSYSGRGMYGKTCLGITGENSATIIREIISVIFSLHKKSERFPVYMLEDTLQEFLEYSQDNMGLDTIIYWPNIPFPTKEEDKKLFEILKKKYEQ